jgi:hypothetical protein
VPGRELINFCLIEFFSTDRAKRSRGRDTPDEIKRTPLRYAEWWRGTRPRSAMPQIGDDNRQEKMKMNRLFTAAALAVTALSLIGTAQAFAGATKHVRHVARAHSNVKGYGAYALVPNNNFYTVPSSFGPADRFGEASQR